MLPRSRRFSRYATLHLPLGTASHLTRRQKLDLHCIDNVPHNPDNLLIQCESCNKWLHGPCLEKAAVQAECKGAGVSPTTNTPAKRGRKKKNTNSAAPFVAKLGYFGGGTQMRLTVTDRRSGPDNTKSWDVPIKCLLCSALIEDVHDEAELDSDATVPKPNKTDVPETPANRSTEEDEESSPVAGNDMSSPIKPAPPELADSLITTTDLAADPSTNGPGETVTPPPS